MSLLCPSRRTLVLTLSVLASVVLRSPALSADECGGLVNQSIRWVVPSNPGGGYDAYSRLIQPFLEQRLQANIVIVNRPEAGGVVGAALIRNARADGKTLGIINASGLMAAHLGGQGDVPDPSDDFTVLGRVVSNRMVLFTGRDSGISDIQDLLGMAAARPVVVGARDAGSAGFFVFPIAAHYLGLDYSLVTGYVGSTERVLAAVRGEVDVIVQTLDSVMPYVISGELRPLLWISRRADVEQLQGLPFTVPALDELDRRPGQSDTPVNFIPVDAELEVAAVSTMLAAGRLLVAPAGLPEGVRSCLKVAVIEVLRSVELQRVALAAGLSIEPADARQAEEDLQASKRHMQEFLPLVRRSIDQATR